MPENAQAERERHDQEKAADNKRRQERLGDVPVEAEAAQSETAPEPHSE